MPERTELLRWQYELTWSLLELHLAELEPADFTWLPAANHWTMHPDGNGGWVPDWAETEPSPIPVPTLGWVSWHLGWWWSVTLDHLTGRAPRDRTEIAWPGPGQPTVDWLRGLHAEWTTVLERLTDADLDAPAPFPWPDGDRTIAHTIAWVNAELMKNAAEIGHLRLLHAAA
ncbi:DinB family protein [Amycolatopsis albispora]|uniref:Damage-inducible protein DinB n=1 Tax=Amycolatopsis albispora TaxID=1804986 RepID=A0A344LGT5_9PSEU|nr:DinB family protein [Amycolatopsis albispora]AXB47259.1 damage-inducible protein DinB [Amycolatopsis albispora]